MTTQKASVAKMSLLIFITEPKSWGFSPIQLNLVFEKKHYSDLELSYLDFAFENIFSALLNYRVHL